VDVAGKAEAKTTGEPERAQIEVTTWVTKHVGGDGTGSKLFDEAIGRGDTTRSVLRRFTAKFPELDSALWSPDHTELGSHIEVLVNDEVLGVSYELDSPLTGGERITPPAPPRPPVSELAAGQHRVEHLQHLVDLVASHVQCRHEA